MNQLQQLFSDYNYGYELGRTRGLGEKRNYHYLEIIAISLGRDDYIAKNKKKNISEVKLAIQNIKENEPIVWKTDRNDKLENCFKIIQIPLIAKNSYSLSEFKEIYCEAYMTRSQFNLISYMKSIGKFSFIDVEKLLCRCEVEVMIADL